jgi:precorrin-2 dehydrogenase / sirohydrochlorin ferrochelatase
MAYYPVYLDMTHRPCLVVGGGGVGTRKAQTLVECGAVVTVISPKASEKLLALSNEGIIELKVRDYDASDLAGMFIVIGATDDEALNRRISRDARNHGVICNIVDRPEICDFIVPSIIRRGDLIVAISTSGKSPAFAKHLRQTLEKQFGNEYEPFLRLMGAIRKKLLKTDHAPEAHKDLFNRIIDEDLLGMIRAQNEEHINATLIHIFGDGFDVASLLKENETEQNS